MAEWKNGLFGCFSDVKLCFITYLFAPYVHGKTAEKVGEDCVKCGIAAACPVANIIAFLKIREKIRETNGIAGSKGNDCVAGFFCPLCAIVQNAAEVGALDMAVEEIERE